MDIIACAFFVQVPVDDITTVRTYVRKRGYPSELNREDGDTAWSNHRYNSSDAL